MSSHSTDTTEIWKDVVGYEGRYEVSDQGRVRSVDRIYIRHREGWADGKYPMKGRILQQHIQKRYWTVTLSDNSKNRTCSIHRLVLEAFIGPCPEGLECRHYPDRDPANNKLNNLSWGTRDRNTEDKLEMGTCAKKLDPNKVRLIRRLYATGNYSYLRIANTIHISPSSVGEVIIGKTWNHIN